MEHKEKEQRGWVGRADDGEQRKIFDFLSNTLDDCDGFVCVWYKVHDEGIEPAAITTLEPMDTVGLLRLLADKMEEDALKLN